MTTPQSPIAVLTLNPAVDMTYEISQLLPDEKVHAFATRFDPGGNGINVSRGLKRLDTDAHCFCVLGGEIGNLLERLLRQQIDTLTFERVEGETRINGTAIEHQSAAQYEVSGIGPCIPDESLDRLLHTFVASTGSGFGVLTGSIQLENAGDFYAHLVNRIRSNGGKTVVDAHGELFRQAVQAKPFLIKPNQYELEQLVGESIDTIEEAALQARKLQRGGVENVCVSLGSRGAVFVDSTHIWHAIPPPVKVDSTVGAGDSMVAGLVSALSGDKPVEDALRLAVACSAGTASKPGTELFSPDDVAVLVEKVVIQKIEV
jgi:6-phosphofructokinase 2